MIRKWGSLLAGKGRRRFDQASRADNTQILAPLLALLVALALVMLGVLSVSARTAERMSRERQILQIAHFLDLEREKWRSTVGSRQPDTKTDWRFIVKPDGRIVSASLAVSERTELAESLALFITGRVRGLTGPAALLSNVSSDQPRADYLRTPSGPFIAGITAFDARKQQALLFLRPLDEDFFRPLSQRLKLRQVRLHVGDEPQAQGLRTWVRDQRGQKIAAIDWDFPYGKSFLFFLPVLILTLILSGSFAILFSRRIRRVINRLAAGRDLAQHPALRDSLTGLANRTLFSDRLQKALSHLDQLEGGIAVFYIDLDNFRDINGTLGHQTGDALICEIGHRLSEACRAEDTLARMGGDEFALLQTLSGSSATSSRLARRLLADIARPALLAGQRLYVSASIGIARIESSGLSGKDAMRQADMALYRAKDCGGNGYSFFEPEMDEALCRRKAIEADLREAVEHDQLKTVYQPQMSPDGSIMHGVEALLRWQHPEKGMISPAEFISVAEQSGLISTLGDYVMAQALADARHWPDLTIAVNVSAVELHQPDYAGNLAAKAERLGIEPRRIELEITETALLKKTEAVAGVIRQLKDHGFKIVLDDFGTEYSSLSYLRQHSVDRLKIDRAFVSAIGERHDAIAVINAIIQIGAALGLPVTAEGVETEKQKNILRHAGCSSLQGYLLARPMSAQAINMIIARANKTRLKTAS